MPTFIKYPINPPFHKKLKADVFVMLGKFEITANSYNYYPVKNNVQFYLKVSRNKIHIIEYGYNINIEKCTKSETALLVNKWRLDNKIKLPRKFKKSIVRTIKLRKKIKNIYMFYN